MPLEERIMSDVKGGIILMAIYEGDTASYTTRHRAFVVCMRPNNTLLCWNLTHLLSHFHAWPVLNSGPHTYLRDARDEINFIIFVVYRSK